MFCSFFVCSPVLNIYAQVLRSVIAKKVKAFYFVFVEKNIRKAFY